MALCASVALAGCVTARQTSPDAWCQTNRPWRPQTMAEFDAMSTETQRQMVAHNEFGEQQCGWKPAGED